MKSAGQINQKLKQVRFRHVKREIESLLRRTPQNCANNTKVESPTGLLGVCKLDCQTCDPVLKDRSGACGGFAFLHKGEDIKESLQNFFSTKSLPEIAIRFPDVAALRWALDSDEDPATQEEYQSAPIPLGVHWGAKVWTESTKEAEAFRKGVEASLEEIASLRDKVYHLSVEADNLSGTLRGETERLSDSLTASQLRQDEAEAKAEYAQAQLEAREREVVQLRAERDTLLDILREKKESPKTEIQPIVAPFWSRIFG